MFSTEGRSFPLFRRKYNCMLLNGSEPPSTKQSDRKEGLLRGRIKEKGETETCRSLTSPNRFWSLLKDLSLRNHWVNPLKASTQHLADPKGWLASTKSKHMLKFKIHRHAVMNKNLLPTWHLPWECLQWASTYCISRDVKRMRMPLRWRVLWPIWHPPRLDCFLSIQYYMSC